MTAWNRSRNSNTKSAHTRDYPKERTSTRRSRNASKPCFALVCLTITAGAAPVLADPFLRLGNSASDAGTEADPPPIAPTTESLQIVDQASNSVYASQDWLCSAEAVGGTPPYAWSFSSLETGATFAVDPATGDVTGYSIYPGDYTGTISVTDTDGATASLPVIASFLDTGTNIDNTDDPTVTVVDGTP